MTTAEKRTNNFRGIIVPELSNFVLGICTCLIHPDPCPVHTRDTIIKEVCNLFDVTVITDIEEDEHKTFPVFAIGSRGEPAAGLRYFTLSPYFRTQVELEQWCQRNLNKLKECADREELPDAIHWA